MTQVHEEQTDAFASKEELMVSLVPHGGELKINLEALRSNVDGLEGNVKGLKDILEDLKGPKKDLRCIKNEVKKLKKQPPEPPAV
jgi:hypothetical protein